MTYFWFLCVCRATSVPWRGCTPPLSVMRGRGSVYSSMALSNPKCSALTELEEEVGATLDLNDGRSRASIRIHMAETARGGHRSTA